ncbi:MAG: sigma-70 family RNA polymerase sigma factor [Holophagae bacterium]|jgi:RNA polymerase sigma-70 factor (ECF subfamily)
MADTLGPGWLREPSSDSTRAGRAREDRWRSIFAALADGRVAALDELYDLSAGDVYRLALWRTGSAEDAEDVVHDVFIRVAEQGPRLTAVRHPRRWLLTVARRCAIDVARRTRRRRAEPVDDVPYLEAPSADPDRAADARRVSRLVGELPSKQREVVLLRHFAECTFAEIGSITGVPTFTTASRYRLAIRRLRRLLEGYHEPSR